MIMTSDFDEIRHGFERRMEDLIVDISNIRDSNGIKMSIYQGDLIRSFNQVMNSIGVQYYSEIYRITPGDRHNED